MIMSLITANTGGSTKRSVVTAAFFVAYCVGNIIGPFAFKSNEAPKYTSGIVAILVAYTLEIALLFVFAAYAIWLNQRKQRQQSVDTMDESPESRALNSFGDLTDGENMAFRFTY